MLNNSFEISKVVAYHLFQSRRSLFCSGVTMTLSTQLEGKNLAQGGHKFGFGLDFEA